MPFGLSGEHLVILFIILILVGPKRIPDIARSLGKTYRNFKDSVDGVREAVYREVPDPTSPKAKTTEAIDTPAQPSAETHSSPKDPSDGKS